MEFLAASRDILVGAFIGLATVWSLVVGRCVDSTKGFMLTWRVWKILSKLEGKGSCPCKDFKKYCLLGGGRVAGSGWRAIQFTNTAGRVAGRNPGVYLELLVPVGLKIHYV